MRKLPRASMKKTRLNKLGKVTITIVILSFITLLFFSQKLASNQKAEAKNKISLIQTNQKAGIKKETEQINQSPKKNDKLKQQNNTATNKKPQSVHKSGNSQKTKTSKVSKETDALGNKGGTNKTKEKRTALETGKVVYLTFDDGPHPTASKKILQLLDQYHAKATYFMLEPNMKRNPDLVNSIKRKGHTLGVHGVTHDISKTYKSPENFVNEMKQAIDFIQETTGIDTRLIRAPYGSKPYVTSPFKEASDRNSFILWDWNVDSRDWKLSNGEFINNTIHQVNQLVDKEPLVVLMHEKPTTAIHLEKLLQFFQKNGYEMKAIDEAMTPIQFK